MRNLIFWMKVVRCCKTIKAWYHTQMGNYYFRAYAKRAKEGLAHRDIINHDCIDNLCEDVPSDKIILAELEARLEISLHENSLPLDFAKLCELDLPEEVVTLIDRVMGLRSKLLKRNLLGRSETLLPKYFLNTTEDNNNG